MKNCNNSIIVIAIQMVYKNFGDDFIIKSTIEIKIKRKPGPDKKWILFMLTAILEVCLFFMLVNPLVQLITYEALAIAAKVLLLIILCIILLYTLRLYDIVRIDSNKLTAWLKFISLPLVILSEFVAVMLLCDVLKENLSESTVTLIGYFVFGGLIMATTQIFEINIIWEIPREN